MRTKATVKNYNMEIIGYDGNRLKGNWTGGVRTKVQNSYITIPRTSSLQTESTHHAETRSVLFLSDGRRFQWSCI